MGLLRIYIRKWVKKLFLVLFSALYLNLVVLIQQTPEFKQNISETMDPHQVKEQTIMHDTVRVTKTNMIHTVKYEQRQTFASTNKTTSIMPTVVAEDTVPVFMPNGALKEFAPSMMKYPRPTYIKESRNPCFYVITRDKKTKTERKRLYCLPLVYLIGFAKSGSTDLHENIIQHQHIVPGDVKEPQYWYQTIRRKKNPTFGKMLKSYGQITQLIEKNCLPQNTQLLNISHVRRQRRFKKFLNVKTVPGLLSYRDKEQQCPLITVDSSPMYIYEGMDYEKDPLNAGALEPRVLTPHRLKHFVDCPKLVVLMRDPVERLFSDFRFFAQAKSGSEYFHTLVVNGIAWWKKCLQELPLYRCAFGRNYNGTTVPSLNPAGYFDWGDNETYGHNGANRLRYSIYVIYIQKWLEVFPRECFLFLKTEQYSDNPVSILTEQVFPFLELESMTPGDLDKLQKLQHRGHANTTRNRKMAMLPETRQILQDFYRPYNEQLVELLGESKFKWY